MKFCYFWPFFACLVTYKWYMVTCTYTYVHDSFVCTCKHRILFKIIIIIICMVQSITEFICFSGMMGCTAWWLTDKIDILYIIQVWLLLLYCVMRLQIGRVRYIHIRHDLLITSVWNHLPFPYNYPSLSSQCSCIIGLQYNHLLTLYISDREVLLWLGLSIIIISKTFIGGI